MRKPRALGPIVPNPAFLAPPVKATARPTWVEKTLADRANTAALAEWVAAGAPTVADRILALLPATLMDLACELDIPFASMRGHALGLVRLGRARLLRGRLVRVE